MNNFLEALRSATAQQHKALESTRISKKLLSDDIIAADYGAYLERLHGFVAIFEKNVLPDIITAFPRFDLTPKVDLLYNDLTHLGSDISALRYVADEELKSIYVSNAAKLGGLYVLEGSTLGGLVIKQHLRSKLGEEILPATTYLSVYGKETGTHWRSFLQTFCAAAESTNPEEVIDGAVNTFHFLFQWMDNAQSL